MTCIQAWIDSLSLLKPKNIKLFLLVTVKSIIDTYKKLLVYWSWLFIVVILLKVNLFYNLFALGSYGIAFYYFFYHALIFGVVLTARSSLEKKNCAYFRSYMISYLPIYLVLLAMSYWGWPTVFSFWYIAAILFFLDSSLQLKNLVSSLYKAAIMTIYNIPLLFFMTTLALAVMALLGYGFLSIVSLAYNNNESTVFLLADIMQIVCIPISVCLYTNIYIKKLHDQFDLYYKQPC